MFPGERWGVPWQQKILFRHMVKGLHDVFFLEGSAMLTCSSLRNRLFCFDRFVCFLNLSKAASCPMSHALESLPTWPSVQERGERKQQHVKNEQSPGCPSVSQKWFSSKLVLPCPHTFKDESHYINTNITFFLLSPICCQMIGLNIVFNLISEV